jgi:serine/threonine protein kinase
MSVATTQKRPRQGGWFTSDVEVHPVNERLGNAMLAKGAFGEISVAILIEQQRKQLVVVKTIGQAVAGGGFGSTATKQLTQEICNEILALRILSDGHPNIVTFLGLTASTNQMLPSALCLVFEYSPIDLHTVIMRRRQTLPFDMIRFVTKEILSALQHCHSRGILHRDVTPKNLLISTQGRIQLCDFGLARPCPLLLDGYLLEESLSNSRNTDKGMCTLYYRPPEILLGGAAVLGSVDMYSCGLIVAELVTGQPLFAGKNVLDQIHRTFQILGTPSLATDEWVQKLADFAKVSFKHYDPQPLENVLPRASECPHLVDLINSLVRLDPSQRLTSKAALEHAFCCEELLTISAVDLIPTECKSFISSKASMEMAEQEALSLAASRRAWNNNKQTLGESSTRRRTLQDALQQ